MMRDIVVTNFTWYGCEQNNTIKKLALCNSKCVQLIKAAVSVQKFGKVTNDIFVQSMMAAITLAKQRVRNKNPAAQGIRRIRL